MPSTFLTASWRKLIMVQYRVDPAVLARYVPDGVELDLYRGACYVSLVGFLFDAVRIKRLAIPFHTRFEEVNLRFYVARTEANGTRKRGVVFIREYVPRAAITIVANSLYEEPYATLPMRHSIVAANDALSVSYSWRHKGVWQTMAVEAGPTPGPIASGSEEEFVTEHYWGYTKRTRGRTSEYGVLHPRWSVYPVRGFAVQADFGAMYGAAFAELSDAAPASALLAEGSAVSVAHGTRLV